MENKEELSEQQKKKIFEKYTKYFNDFVHGKYCEIKACLCTPKPKKPEDCSCRVKK